MCATNPRPFPPVCVLARGGVGPGEPLKKSAHHHQNGPDSLPAPLRKRGHFALFREKVGIKWDTFLCDARVRTYVGCGTEIEFSAHKILGVFSHTPPPSREGDPCTVSSVARGYPLTNDPNPGIISWRDNPGWREKRRDGHGVAFFMY